MLTEGNMYDKNDIDGFLVRGFSSFSRGSGFVGSIGF
jgi:hypothetical protein